MLNLHKTLLICEVLELLNLFSVYKYLKGGYVGAGHSAHKLKHMSLCLDIRKHFFTGMVTEHTGHRLPVETVESPSLEIYKPFI